jgi:hypothetical protein
MTTEEMIINLKQGTKSEEIYRQLQGSIVEQVYLILKALELYDITAFGNFVKTTKHIDGKEVFKKIKRYYDANGLKYCHQLKDVDNPALLTHYLKLFEEL